MSKIRTQERLLYKKLISTPFTEIASQLLEVLGARLVVLVGGLSDPKAVFEYVRGERNPQPKAVERLRLAHRVMAILLLGNLSKEAIQSWFVGMNPDLDDEAPADVILEDPKRVLEAARAFVDAEPEITMTNQPNDGASTNNEGDTNLVQASEGDGEAVQG